MDAKGSLKRMIRMFGYDIVRFNPSTHLLARRKYLLDNYRIDLVIDVGANTGQYGRQLRSIGYKRKIVSFEPLSSAYKALAITAKESAPWDAFNLALGAENGHTTIHIAGNSCSSSILPMLPAHEKAEPTSRYVGAEQIEVRTLDSLFDTISGSAGAILLKIDAQGFEKEVLAGATKALRFIDTIQLEMSFAPLYGGEMLFPEMYRTLAILGYRIAAIEPGFSDPDTGELLQADGIFHRW